MRNIANAGRHFVTFLLAPGTPQSLRPLVNQIVNGFSGATLRIDQLLDLMVQLVRRFSDGSYLERGPLSRSGKDLVFVPKCLIFLHADCL